MSIRKHPAYQALSRMTALRRLRASLGLAPVPKFAKRVVDRTKESQEDVWTGISTKIDRLISERPDDQLASILSELREVNISRAEPNQFYRKRRDFKGFAEALFSKHGTSAEDTFFYPVVAGGTYGLNHISPIRYIMNHVRPETEAIVELGSGWSCNLFQTYVGLGRTRCAELDFVGAEYTEQGRDCARRIAGFDQNIRFADHHMDYWAPDVSFLQGYKRHILVFTHHSIEQVEEISDQLYTDLSALNADVTLMHFEPVGWQRVAKLMAARKADDTAYFHRLGTAFPTATRTAKDQLQNAAWWSWKRRYNTNLTEIIDRFEQRGDVKTIRRVYDFGGIGNVLNPTTLYHMKFVKP